MRKYILSLLIAVISLTATSQSLTYQPLVGLENSLSKISYNQAGSFRNLKSLITPTVGLRIDYRFKQLGGPYIGVVSSRPSVEYSFSDPATGKTNYSSEAGDVQVQFQAGYQLTSTKIFFKKASSYMNHGKSFNSPMHRSCGQGGGHHCCGSAGSRAKNSTPYMRLLPSAGIAYMPFNDGELETETKAGKTVYTYGAGSPKVAFTTGMGFEFGVGNRKSVIVSLNYFKGLGNNEQTLSSAPDQTKPTVLSNTTLQSKSSGWNATLGFPITFKTAHKERHERIVRVVRSCSQMHHTCGDR